MEKWALSGYVETSLANRASPGRKLHKKRTALAILLDTSSIFTDRLCGNSTQKVLLERFTAAARLHGVGVFERESLTL